jgi:hypothetical protein
LVCGDISWIKLHSKHYCGDQIDENEIGGACGTLGRGRQKFIENFWGGRGQKERDHLKTYRLDWGMISN